MYHRSNVTQLLCDETEFAKACNGQEFLSDFPLLLPAEFMYLNELSGKE